MNLFPPQSQLDLLFLSLLALFALFPEDCVMFADLTRLWVLSRLLNYYLMLRAWLIYRQLKADMVRMGMPAPPFKFIPIWQRPPLEKRP